MNQLIETSKRFLNRHSSTILTFAGVAGVVTTAIVTAKATPKALILMEEAKKEKGKILTKTEKFKVAAPVYIPAVFVGTATIACIFGANLLNKRHQAALMSAYALVDSSFRDYKDKLKELYGEETHNNVIDHIMVEKAGDVKITSSYMMDDNDLAIEEQGTTRLFYDVYSERYFESTIEKVMNAEYHLNRNYTLRGSCFLNEFYEFLGIEETEYGSVMGWAPYDEGMYWIEFNHRKAELNDGREVIVIDMPFAPFYDFLDAW